MGLLPDTQTYGLRMRRECRECFPHHLKHVPWCMPGSLISGFLWNWWRGKRSRHSRRMRNSQFAYLVRSPLKSFCIWINSFIFKQQSVDFDAFSGPFTRVHRKVHCVVLLFNWGVMELTGIVIFVIMLSSLLGKRLRIGLLALFRTEALTVLSWRRPCSSCRVSDEGGILHNTETFVIPFPLFDIYTI